LIAYGIRGSDAQGDYGRVFTVRVKDGQEKAITSYRWSWVVAHEWLRDGSGMIVTASDQAAGSTRQIWHVSYPAGEVRRITNDLNNYLSVSLTADSKALVTVQTEQVSNIWVAPNADASRATQITSNRFDGPWGISWTPDGKIVYVSRTSGNRDLWMMNADGTGQQQLTFNAGDNIRPLVSPDGRYIVFSSNRAGGWNIWRIETSGGGEPKRLTTGSNDYRPQFTPDGQWVLYTSSDAANRQKATKVSIDGGNPVLLTDYHSAAPVVSPDGRQIALSYIDEQQSPPRWRLGIISSEGGSPTKTFDIPSGSMQTYTWTLDGRAINYMDTRAGITNIWSQPIDGSPPKQLTNFKSDRIFYFDWSRDGKQLALARGTLTRDVLMIADLK
jgi:Tol biopolymer transport system component